MIKEEGFTVIELIVVIAVFLILVASSITILTGQIQEEDLDGKAKQVVSFIERARTNSVSGYLGSVWGINIIDSSTTCDELEDQNLDCLVLFEGEDYYSSPTGTRQYLRFGNTGVFFTSSEEEEFYFKYISGWMSTSANRLLLQNNVGESVNVSTTATGMSYYEYQ